MHITRTTGTVRRLQPNASWGQPQPQTSQPSQHQPTTSSALRSTQQPHHTASSPVMSSPIFHDTVGLRGALRQLQQSAASTTTPQSEVDIWVKANNVLSIVDTLVSHLLRAMPKDVYHEIARWAEERTQQGVGQGSELLMTDIVKVRERTITCDGAGRSYEILWHQQLCWMLLLERVVPHTVSVSESRRHNCKLTSLTSALPKLVKVRHENVVEVLCVHRADREVALVTEYYPKGSLGDMFREWTNTEDRLTVKQYLSIAASVLRGLQWVHTWSLVHRNINCSNVLRGGRADDNVVYKLGGLEYCVLAHKDVAVSDAWLPSPVPPEVLQTRSYDASSDVYVFGSFLVELAHYGVMPKGSLTHIVCPPSFPIELWNTILEPCIGPKEQRPTVSALLELITTTRHVEGIPLDKVVLPCPKDKDVTWQSLSTCAEYHMPLISYCSPMVVFSDMSALCTMLEDVLSRNTGLREITIRDVDFTTTTFNTNTFSHHAWVTKSQANLLDAIRFQNCSFNTPYCNMFLQQLLKHFKSSLQTLELSCCTFPERSCRTTVLDCLPALQELRRLSVYNWGEGTTLFKDLIKSCPTAALTELDVGGNNITSNAAYELCHLIEKLSVLSTVKMDTTKCGSMDYTALGVVVQCLRYKTSVRHVWFRGLPMSSASAHLLKIMVMGNKQMLSLELDTNNNVNMTSSYSALVERLEEPRAVTILKEIEAELSQRHHH
eukprot:PhF_6_TR10817/c0_g1_i4/m.17435